MEDADQTVGDGSEGLVMGVSLGPMPVAEETSGVLMDQCSRHVIPPAVRLSPPTGRDTI